MKLDPRQTLGTTVSPRVGAPIPFTRANALAPFVDFLDEIGVPTDRLLRRARIPAKLLEEPEGLVPLYPAYRLIELAARQEYLEDLGIVVGRRASAFELGAYGVALQGASTVYQYIQLGIRLIGTHSSGTRFWLSAEGDVSRVNQYLKGPSGLGRCVADVYTLVLTINMLRRFVGPAWSPGEIRLMAGDEMLLGDRSALGDAPLITGQCHSSFTIPRPLMRLPVPGAGAGSLMNEGVLSGEGRPMPADFAASTEQLVVSLLAGGYPSIHAAAESAGMSSRTLQRRLAEAGMTYSGLVAASRVRLARDWLTESDMPIAEIAVGLGYADVSNFARAFRRETGISPRAFRFNEAED